MKFIQFYVSLILTCATILHMPDLDARGRSGGGGGSHGHRYGGGGHYHGGGRYHGRGYGYRGGYYGRRGYYGRGGWGYDPYWAWGVGAAGITAAAVASDSSDSEAAYEAGYQRSKVESLEEEQARLEAENQRLRTQHKMKAQAEE